MTLKEPSLEQQIVGWFKEYQRPERSVERNRYNVRLTQRFKKAPWWIPQDYRDLVRHELLEAHMRIYDMAQDQRIVRGT